MRDPNTDRRYRVTGSTPGGGNGGGVIDPLDRSYLLRRASRFPFPKLANADEVVRLRRERRVSASFSAIRPLARNDRS